MKIRFVHRSQTFSVEDNDKYLSARGQEKELTRTACYTSSKWGKYIRRFLLWKQGHSLTVCRFRLAMAVLPAIDSKSTSRDHSFHASSPTNGRGSFVGDTVQMRPGLGRLARQPAFAPAILKDFVPPPRRSRRKLRRRRFILCETLAILLLVFLTGLNSKPKTGDSLLENAADPSRGGGRRLDSRFLLRVARVELPLTAVEGGLPKAVSSSQACGTSGLIDVRSGRIVGLP